ncbi:MAG: hypothetical protein LBC53_10415 [Spirochaetaceae bacterium]|jgi:hypothetical protein|nr:hypothetical protein [Spirochaetaceae bacterium]
MDNKIELLECNEKKIFYFNISHFKNNDQFLEFIKCAKETLSSYKKDKLYFSITNVTGVFYDSETKKLMADWMLFNKPYIKMGVVIGLDGIKRIMVSSLMQISGRKDLKFLSTKEEAVEWIVNFD